MKTISMDIDEQIWLCAQQKAAAENTSLSEVVADYLKSWASDDALKQARDIMVQRFSQPDWRFTVGAPDGREQRNARS